MNLLGRLFGEKKSIEHPFFGTITSQRIKSKNQLKSYTWHGEYIFENAKLETVITFEGDSSGPYQGHIEDIMEIINNWGSKYFPKIEGEIKLNPTYKNWQNCHYVSWIYPIDEDASFYEVVLEPINDSDSFFFSVEIYKKTIKNIRIR